METLELSNNKHSVRGRMYRDNVARFYAKRLLVRSGIPEDRITELMIECKQIQIINQRLAAKAEQVLSNK